MNTTTRIPIVLMSVEETAQAVSISVKTAYCLDADAYCLRCFLYGHQHDWNASCSIHFYRYF